MQKRLTSSSTKLASRDIDASVSASKTPSSNSRSFTPAGTASRNNNSASSASQLQMTRLSNQTTKKTLPTTPGNNPTVKKGVKDLKVYKKQAKQIRNSIKNGLRRDQTLRQSKLNNKDIAAALNQEEDVKKCVALMAPENRIIFAALLRRLKWKRIKHVEPKHIIRTNFSSSYSKTVEMLQSRNQGGSSPQQTGGFFANQAQEDPQFPTDEESKLIDLLWVGNHDPQQLIPSSLSHFRVVFNGLDNINELLDMRMLRDQLYLVRSSILAKTQLSIPHFLLDKYYPSQAEIVSIQKLVTFELKILSHQVIHSVQLAKPKYLVQTAIEVGRTSEKFGNKRGGGKSLPRKKEQALVQIRDNSTSDAQFLPGLKRSVTFIKIREIVEDETKSNQSGLQVKHLMAQQKARQQVVESNSLYDKHLGEFLFRDNEEFRQKTQTGYIVKQGFTMEKIKMLEKGLAVQNRAVEKDQSFEVQSAAKKTIFTKKKSRADLERELAANQPCVVRKLLNPLLWHGNNICTVSVYVFVESFDTLRSHIFNNVKVRFRQSLDYYEDADFQKSGFGKGKTLYRFTLEELIKLLYRRDGSKQENLNQQRKVFWNRICQKIIFMLLLMKAQTQQTHGADKSVPLNKFCQLLQFRFQIDRIGRPWLFGIKSDSTKFQMKGNSFDHFKRHLFLQTLICIQKKVHAVIKREKSAQQQKNLLFLCKDMSGVQQVLHQNVRDFEYGETHSGNTKRQRRVIDGVIGCVEANNSSESVLAALNNFDQWTKSNLSVKKLKFQDNLSTRSHFDTNFNATQMATRRIERSLFLKLKHNEEELTNVYKYRVNKQSAGRIDPRNLTTTEQKQWAIHQRIYYMGEQQLIEDLQETLQQTCSDDLVDKINVLKSSGSVLLREGLRLILRDDHKNDIDSLVRDSKLLSEIVKIGDDWVQNSLKFVILGVKDALVFLCQCIKKLRLVEDANRSDLRSFKILQKYRGEELDLATVEQVQQIKQEEIVLRRRKSNVVNPEQMQDILKKSAAKVYIRDKLTSYFNEPTEYERRKLAIQQNREKFEKEKRDAIRSSAFLRQSIGLDALAEMENRIDEEESSEGSTSKEYNSRNRTNAKVKIGSFTSSTSTFDCNASGKGSEASKKSKLSPVKKVDEDGSSSSQELMHTNTQKPMSGFLRQLEVVKRTSDSVSDLRMIKNTMSSLKVPKTNPIILKTGRKSTPLWQQRKEGIQEVSMDQKIDSRASSCNSRRSSFDLSKQDDDFFKEMPAFDNSAQDMLDEEHSASKIDSFYAQLKKKTKVSANQISAARMIKRNESIENTLRKNNDSGQLYHLQVKDAAAKPLQKIKLSQTPVKSNQNSSQTARLNMLTPMAQSQVSLPATTSKLQPQIAHSASARKIPMLKLKKAPTKNKDLKVDEKSQQQQNDSLNMSLSTLNPLIKSNKAKQVASNYYQFLQQHFQAKIPFMKKSRQQQINRLQRSQAEPLVVGGQKDQRLQLSKSVSDLRNTNHSAQSFIPGQGSLIKSASARGHLEPSYVRLQQPKKPQHLCQSADKNNKLTTSESFNMSHSHSSMFPVANRVVEPVSILRRNSLMRPQMQVQLKTFERKQTAQQQIQGRIKNLQRADSILTTSSIDEIMFQGDLKQRISTVNGVETDVFLSKEKAKSYLKKMKKAKKRQKEFSSSSSSGDSDSFSSSSSSSSESSFQSENLSEWDMSSQSESNQGKQKKRKSKEVFVTNIEEQSDDIEAHVAKNQISREILAFISKDTIRSAEYMFKPLYPMDASCNDDKNEGSFKRIPVKKHTKEIYVPLGDLKQLQPCDDNILARQCIIENTVHRVMKIMHTHDFSKQIELEHHHHHHHHRK